MANKDKVGVLYILEIQGSIKIGFSCNINLMQNNIRRLNIEFADDSLDRVVKMYGFVRTIELRKQLIRNKLNSHQLNSKILNENGNIYQDFYINTSTTRNVLASLIGNSAIRDFNVQAAQSLIANLHTDRPFSI